MKAGTPLRYRLAGGGDKLPSVADDKARAERIILTDADFPGLEREDDEEDDDDESDSFRQCLNENQMLADLGEGPRSAEATFSDEDETLARASAVNLAESEDEAEEAFAELEQSSFVGCFENAIRTGFGDELGDGVEIDDLSVSELRVGDLGDEAIGYRATVDLVGQDDEASFAFDYVFIRVGRAVGVLFSFDIDTTFDEDDRERLSETLADRMADEL